MTNSGLYSGIYQQVREYAELVDNLLVRLKTNEGDNKSMRFELADILSELSTEGTGTLSTQMTAMFAIGDDTTSRTRWLQLANKLKSENIDTKVISELENLALLLEKVQANAVAKMRGWSR